MVKNKLRVLSLILALLLCAGLGTSQSEAADFFTDSPSIELDGLAEIAHPSGEITKAEAQIESIVYDLFNPTPDEIALLESVV